MLKSALLLIISSSAFLLCAYLPGAIVGPGTFIFQSYENCDPPVTEVKIWLSQRKFNRTTSVFDMSFTSPWPMSDDIIMEINTARKTDGGYKPGSFYIKGPFCTTVRTLAEGIFNEILAAVGLDDCPIPSDTKLDGFYIGELQEQMLYGEYRSQWLFFIEEELKGCYLLYMKMVPRED